MLDKIYLWIFVSKHLQYLEEDTHSHWSDNNWLQNRLLHELIYQFSHEYVQSLFDLYHLPAFV
jgi:hypothetical protein